jgi:hypothetical protein
MIHSYTNPVVNIDIDVIPISDTITMNNTQIWWLYWYWMNNNCNIWWQSSITTNPVSYFSMNQSNPCRLFSLDNNEQAMYDLVQHRYWSKLEQRNISEYGRILFKWKTCDNAISIYKTRACTKNWTWPIQYTSMLLRANKRN